MSANEMNAQTFESPNTRYISALVEAQPCLSLSLRPKTESKGFEELGGCASTQMLWCSHMSWPLSVVQLSLLCRIWFAV